jgi:hypothetical protein
VGRPVGVRVPPSAPVEICRRSENLGALSFPTGALGGLVPCPYKYFLLWDSLLKEKPYAMVGCRLWAPTNRRKSATLGARQSEAAPPCIWAMPLDDRCVAFTSSSLRSKWREPPKAHRGRVPPSAPWMVYGLLPRSYDHFRRYKDIIPLAALGVFRLIVFLRFFFSLFPETAHPF